MEQSHRLMSCLVGQLCVVFHDLFVRLRLATLKISLNVHFVQSLRTGVRNYFCVFFHQMQAKQTLVPLTQNIFTKLSSIMRQKFNSLGEGLVFVHNNAG